MRTVFFMLALAVFVGSVPAGPAHAQAEKFTATPFCSDLINDTNHSA